MPDPSFVLLAVLVAVILCIPLFGDNPSDVVRMCREREQAVERRALQLFLWENASRGAVENDWRCATEGLRDNYRHEARRRMGAGHG